MSDPRSMNVSLPLSYHTLLHPPLSTVLHLNYRDLYHSTHPLSTIPISIHERLNNLHRFGICIRCTPVLLPHIVLARRATLDFELRLEWILMERILGIYSNTVRHGTGRAKGVAEISERQPSRAQEFGTHHAPEVPHIRSHQLAIILISNVRVGLATAIGIIDWECTSAQPVDGGKSERTRTPDPGDEDLCGVGQVED